MGCLFGRPDRRGPQVLQDVARPGSGLEAQKQLAEADAARRREGLQTPAQLPSTDSDSTVLPNKEGGYAPNYTPTAAVDTHRDYIVDAEVIADANENTEVVPMTERVEEAFGQRPEAVLADGLNATGPNIVELEQRGIEFLSPASAEETTEGNPAVRADPRQAVPEEVGRSCRSARIPEVGQVLLCVRARRECVLLSTWRTAAVGEDQAEYRQGQKITLEVYRCSDCAGCPLAGHASRTRAAAGTVTVIVSPPIASGTPPRCVSPKLVPVTRRFHARETPFGWLKHVLGLRQFLLRGLEKVRTEWLWACTGYNLRKLILEVKRLRAKFAELVAEAVD